MLTGEFCFYSPNFSDILIAICTQPLPLLRSKAPWVPEAVEQWFQRACAREPLDRFQSADEMTEALAAAAGASLLQKHKSFPEGRIAPETLVGYAAPALPNDSSPASMARTQLVIEQVAANAGTLVMGAQTSPGHVAAHSPVVPIVVSGGGSDQTLGTGADWLPARRTVPPLLIGVGVGLVAVALIALLVILTSNSEKQAEATRPSSSPTPSLPIVAATAAAAVAAPTPPAAAVVAAPEAVVSSVAAPSEPAVTPPPTKPKQAGKPARTTPAPTPKTGPARPPGSDLGF
jgi:serine/threonine-protein kinase